MAATLVIWRPMLPSTVVATDLTYVTNSFNSFRSMSLAISPAKQVLSVQWGRSANKRTSARHGHNGYRGRSSGLDLADDLAGSNKGLQRCGRLAGQDPRVYLDLLTGWPLYPRPHSTFL